MRAADRRAARFTARDRGPVLAPMETQCWAVEKIVAGDDQAAGGGPVVIPAAWLTMGRACDQLRHLPVHSRRFACWWRCLGRGRPALETVGPRRRIGLMYTLVWRPMMMFGLAYYHWSSLRLPPVLQYAVLINPLVYPAKACRARWMPECRTFPGLA